MLRGLKAKLALDWRTVFSSQVSPNWDADGEIAFDAVVADLEEKKSKLMKMHIHHLLDLVLE